mgnify:FL=1
MVQVMNNSKILVVFLICNFFTFYSIYSQSTEELIKESISSYSGKCPCPYSVMSNGKKCGNKSAYSRPGGQQPLCYPADIRKQISHDSLRIIDGDTIHLNGVKYRFHGIDAPEMKQLCQINKENYNCGIKSKEFLKKLIGNKPVKCKHKNIDRYKRIIAECFVNNTNLNKELVKNGWALAYTDYSKDYVTDEEFARENKLGIWKGTFILPKKWRKINR